MSRSGYPSRRGISMIEVVVSTMLVSTIMIVSLTASSNLLRNRSVSTESVNGRLLAGRYLDEITSLSFTDPDANAVFGIEPNELASNRMTLDDIDDYNAMVLSPPTTRSGAAVSGLTGWAVAVSVTPADATLAGYVLSADASVALRQISVTATSPSGKIYTAIGLASRTASTFNPSIVHQRRRAISLSFPNGQSLEMDLPLRNHPVGSGS